MATTISSRSSPVTAFNTRLRSSATCRAYGFPGPPRLPLAKRPLASRSWDGFGWDGFRWDGFPNPSRGDETPFGDGGSLPQPSRLWRPASCVAAVATGGTPVATVSECVRLVAALGFWKAASDPAAYSLF